MRVFVYEFLTGGGMLDELTPCSPHLQREGRAMVRAVSEDFAAIDSCQVQVLRDHRYTLWARGLPNSIDETVVHTREEHDRLFRTRAADADFTLVIAPETHGILLRLTYEVLTAGGRLLSPSPDFISIAGDKWKVHETLRSSGVPVPRSALGEPLQASRLPGPPPRAGLVVKPRDGAGSEGILHTTADHYVCGQRELLLEEFAPGQAASVMAVGGPLGVRLLLPCLQCIDREAGFAYQGGVVLSPEDPRSERIWSLAKSALPHLPPFTGLIGLDVVLGNAADGIEDVVIEVNPRVTTSYVGLRAVANANLAETMVAWATGYPCPLEFTYRPLRFTPDGRVLTEDEAAVGRLER